MKRGFFVTAIYLVAVVMSGCAKPDRVTTIKSPMDGVFYTVETFNGHGAADADFTRVYAHLERNGKSDKKLVVDGTYLEISKIIWTGSHDVTLCKEAGITDSFRSEVTLISGDTSETIQNQLQENCKENTGK
jgi:hypothetical protein